MSLNEDMKNFFDDNEIKKIFDDEIKFKMKLNLKDNVYKYLLDAKNLEKFSASLAAGLAVAASGYLAWLATLGIGGKFLLIVGLGANPIGWWALAGFGGAALMYGGKTLIDKFDKEAHDKIPKFLNTPLDYLGQNLLNIILPITIKISMIHGKLTQEDETVIIEQFKNWGYNENYIKDEIKGIRSYIGELNIIDTKKKLQAICKKVDGLEFDALKGLVVETLEDIFSKKTDKTNFMEFTNQIKNLD